MDGFEKLMRYDVESSMRCHNPIDHAAVFQLGWRCGSHREDSSSNVDAVK